MTDHDMAADAKAQAERLRKDADRFLADSEPLVAPPPSADEPTLHMSTADLLRDED